jgi:protein translocase SecG subunit
MTVESILLIIMVILSVITIVAITLQPSQKTGLMGDATDIEKRDKRGAELFLFRSTIILIILFLGTAIAYGAAISGLI